MPEKTAEAWRNGWFHTGDAFRKDADGNFFFVDRKKDALRRRGENVSSFEVEALVASHPPRSRSAPRSASRVELGEQEIKVCVVRRPGAELAARELIEYLLPKMPRYMVPPLLSSFVVSAAEDRGDASRAEGEAARAAAEREHLGSRSSGRDPAPMKGLLVSDIHYPPEAARLARLGRLRLDLVVIAGDHLDIASSVAIEAQVSVTLKYPRARRRGHASRRLFPGTTT